MTRTGEASVERVTRAVVVGTSGCGKTTFAKSLSRKVGVPHIELDTLYWGPNWTARPPDVFRAEISEAIAGPSGVCDGNYSSVRELIWERANIMVWLDYAFPVVFYRAVVRTFTRLATREELFAGNRESWRLMFDRDWIPWWVLRTFRRRRREYAAWFAVRRVNIWRPYDSRHDVTQMRFWRHCQPNVTGSALRDQS